jgi:hypothetical protein
LAEGKMRSRDFGVMGGPMRSSASGDGES